MADFSTKVREWSGGFRAPSPVQPQKDVVGESLAKIIPGLLESAGKGYAIAQGANVLGGSTTNVEAEQAVDSFNQATKASEGMTNAEIEDLKNNALKKFGTDDKKIQALIKAGKISTIEGNARRHQMLQESLSNPVLAMFKEDFLNAAAPFTGGTGKLASQFFGAYQPTEQERAMIEAQERVAVEKGKFEAGINTLMNTFGFDRDTAVQQQRKVAEKQRLVDDAELNSKYRNFTSADRFVASQAVTEGFMNNVSMGLAGISARGSKLSETEIQALGGSIDQAYLKAKNQIMKFAVDADGKAVMSTEDYSKSLKILEDEYKRAKETIGDNSALKALEDANRAVQARLGMLTGQATYELFSSAPGLAAAYKVGGDFGNFYLNLKSGSQAEQFRLRDNPDMQRMADALMGIDARLFAGTGMDKVAKGVGGFSAPEAGATVQYQFTTQGGAKAVTSLTGPQAEAQKELIKQAFSTPAADLSLFTRSDEWMMAAKSPEGAKQAATAVQSSVSKIRGYQAAGAGGFPTTLRVNVVEDTNTETGTTVERYEWHADGSRLDDTAQRELSHMYRLLKNSPQVVKELGAATAEDYVQSVFGRTKPKKGE